MSSLWKQYDPAWRAYEHTLPHAFGWSREFAEEQPRYVCGEDGYWYDPSAVDSTTALLSCTGDLMCEPRMTNAHRYGNAYFFHPLFQYVRDIFHRSDFCIANLETTLSDASCYAGDYHCVAGKYHCNAPACYLDAVRYAGFDALVTANNHNCDSGVGGLWDTLRAVDEHGLMRTGAFLPTDRERVLLVNICGFRVAILSYGNRYNGLDETMWTQAGIDTCLNWFSREKCLRDVAFAKEHGAEFILCYQHWGCDYDTVPNEQQYRILEDMRGCGVDYIVGSHTHCLQSHDTVDGKPMMWSMGNFVTNERKELCKHTGILQLTLRRENGGITVQEHLIPCYVFDEFGTGRFSVVPTDTTLNGGYGHPRMAEINAYIRGRVGDNLAFLPDRSLTLSALCEGMNIPCTLADRPVTTLCVQSGTVCRGAVYFAFDTLTMADKRRAIAADVSAVVTTEAIEGLPCLVIDDVAAAYRAAHAMQRPWGDGAAVVLIAGHTNKTHTREKIARALRTVGGVYTVCDGEHIDTAPWPYLHPAQDYCVLELREDHPLGLREAAALCRPATVIVTSAPCDVAALADALCTGGTVWYNGNDTALCEAVHDITRTDIAVRAYGDVTDIATAMGADETAANTAIDGYVPRGFAECSLEADGVHIVAHTHCKTTAQAEALASKVQRYIAVTTPTFADVFASRATALITVDTEHDVNEAIQTLITTLQDGDTLVLCGEREAQLCQVLRRMFGITDGFLPHCS